MHNRSKMTMFHTHSVGQSRAVSELIDAAVDTVVENCSSPKGMIILALASVAVAGIGMWGVMKLSQDSDSCESDTASEKTRSPGYRS